MSKVKIVKTVFIKAPRAHVWKFLTEADQLALWFHRGGSDLKDGGDYILETNSHGKDGEKICWGRVKEMKVPERLVHTFTHNHLEGVETTCTWTLEEFESGTIITLVHDGWEAYEAGPFVMAADHDKGWDEHFSRLRHVAS